MGDVSRAQIIQSDCSNTNDSKESNKISRDNDCKSNSDQGSHAGNNSLAKGLASEGNNQTENNSGSNDDEHRPSSLIVQYEVDYNPMVAIRERSKAVAGPLLPPKPIDVEVPQATSSTEDSKLTASPTLRSGSQLAGLVKVRAVCVR